jgi:aryl-alcohol dehydrogenase-like predicted oxidoreductase
MKPSSLVFFAYFDASFFRGNPIDLYQIHFPGAWSNEEYWDGIADAYDQGLIKAIGEFIALCYISY